MVVKSLARELSETTYPGRGIVIGRSEDGTKAVSAYLIPETEYLLKKARAFVQRLLTLRSLQTQAL